MATKPTGRTTRKVAATVKRQRSIQHQAKAKKSASPAAGRKKQVQAGSRRQPRNPMPAQHLAKPGIGRAVAVLFAREGADVAVFYLDEHEDAKATKRHVENEGGKCMLFSGDVNDPEFCDSAVCKVVKAFGRLDILVNNAAFQLHAERLEDLSEAHLQETLQTNIDGYFRMARTVLPHLENGASIINTGSETGIFGSRHLLDYSATKGAIHAFTLSLASNLLERGIRVNAVAPGPVWTPLNPADKPAREVAKFGEDSDMGRPAQPEEISPAYVFLASPVTASYINGVVLPVMGGPRG